MTHDLPIRLHNTGDPLMAKAGDEIERLRKKLTATRARLYGLVKKLKQGGKASELIVEIRWIAFHAQEGAPGAPCGCSSNECLKEELPFMNCEREVPTLSVIVRQ